MNSFEIITKYLPQAVDKYFFEDAKTAILEKGTKFIDVNFAETGYVKIANILLDALGDYYQTQQNSENFVSPGSARPSDPANYAAYAGNIGSGERDGFPIGGVSLKWEIFRLQWVRGRQLRIDYIANEETAGVVIGNAVEEFNRTKVIPEVDATRFSYMAGYASASLGNLKTEAEATLGANAVIAAFNEAFAWLSEHEVPADSQIIFVNPTIMRFIRSTNELSRFLTQENYRSDAGIDFTVEKYGERPIIEVPSNRFFTDVLLTQNGYRATSTSKIINYMVVSTKAVLPLRKLEWSKVYDENLSGLAGFHGYLINYLLYHGMVIPKNKVPGLYISVSDKDATTKVNTLAIDTMAGNTVNGWMLRRYFTNPAGLRGTVVYRAAAFTLGADVDLTQAVAEASVDSTHFGIVTEGVEIVSASATSYYFALVDMYGKVVATSGSVTLVKKSA